MKIAPVKYMRDFYPEEMRIREWIEDRWRKASEGAGFQPWDAPIVESLELYKRKSGEEIVSQLYTLTDRGERELAIRPEMTPSLARMVAQRQSALPLPVKWYCMARMCRYERGQRGRLREFWQWNADILGVDSPLADAEIIGLALDGLVLCGLTADDIEVRINSRKLMAAFLTGLGIPEDQHGAVYAIADKRGKIPAQELETLYRKLPFDLTIVERLLAWSTLETLDAVGEFVAGLGMTTASAAVDELRTLFGYLDAIGKKAFCRFDVSIVRGLAYYTGVVFEIFDKASQLRALCGGGRYDRLLETMGGQPMPAVGFGMGDVVLTELLRDLGRLPAADPGIDVYVIPLASGDVPAALKIVGALRGHGRRVDLSFRPANVGKMIKRASDLKVRWAVLVGGPEAPNVRVKNMVTGADELVDTDQLHLLG